MGLELLQKFKVQEDARLFYVSNGLSGAFGISKRRGALCLLFCEFVFLIFTVEMDAIMVL